MTAQLAYACIIILLVWTSINYALPLAQAIVELLNELEKYAIVRKDVDTPTPAKETR